MEIILSLGITGQVWTGKVGKGILKGSNGERQEEKDPRCGILIPKTLNYVISNFCGETAENSLERFLNRESDTGNHYVACTII